MHRVHLDLRPCVGLVFRSNDLIHDALIAGFAASGMPADRLVGAAAEPFCFATHAVPRKGHLHLRGLTISTSSSELGTTLRRLDPCSCTKSRAATGEAISLAGARVLPISSPVIPGVTEIGVVTLSPIVISQRGTRRWLDCFDRKTVQSAVNTRLSRLAGRSVCLEIEADPLYLRRTARPLRRVVVKLLPNGREAYVFGLVLPLRLSGSSDDLDFAWYAGLGEKTRMGFGVIESAERGLSGRIH
jgi:hypothetical protein